VANKKRFSSHGESNAPPRTIKKISLLPKLTS
jgi:hypothetical protein